MNIGKITRIILTINIVVMVLWATFAAIFGAEPDTISAHVRDYGHMYAIIPFAAGCVVGHWWWRMAPPKKRDTASQ